MKKYFLLSFLALVTALTAVQAEPQTFSVPADSRDQRVQRRTPPAPVRRGAIGAFPRATKGGNPIMMIIPGAPRKYYGAPQDTVTTNPYYERDHYTRSEVTGLILFGAAW